MAAQSAESIPLYLFTYNCNKQQLNRNQALNKLTNSLPDQVANLYVFGLEEFCSVLEGCFKDDSNQRLVEYNETFLEALKKKYSKKYRFQTLSMVHIGAVGVMAITPYKSQFSDIRTAKAGRGYGYTSLKGGVGIRLRYTPSDVHKLQGESVELTFSNLHLPAGESEYHYWKRTKCFEELLQSLDFGDDFSVLKPKNHIFIMGDLNYRTTKKHDVESEFTQQILGLKSSQRSNKEQTNTLMKTYDELTIGKQYHDVLQFFSEPPIEFPPTYKYVNGTAIYNTKRSPSWCDRILYLSTYGGQEKSLFKGRLEHTSHNIPTIHSYNSIEEILNSDHRPVYLSISVPFTPPRSLITESGFLRILSENSESQIRTMEEVDTSNVPTDIFMRALRSQQITQYYFRPAADFLLGESLWLTTTTRGRLSILVFVLSIYGLFYIFG